jgi:hypothetical protein
MRYLQFIAAQAQQMGVASNEDALQHVMQVLAAQVDDLSEEEYACFFALHEAMLDYAAANSAICYA